MDDKEIILKSGIKALDGQNKTQQDLAGTVALSPNNGEPIKLGLRTIPTLNCGLASGNTQNVVTAISASQDDKAQNKLVVDSSLPPGTLFCLYDPFATGGAPSSHQAYTVTAGKTLYLTCIIFSNATASANSFTLRDGIADGGTAKFNFQAGSNGPTIYFTSSTPIAFRQGLRIDAADQVANCTNRIAYIGFEA